MKRRRNVTRHGLLTQPTRASQLTATALRIPWDLLSNDIKKRYQQASSTRVENTANSSLTLESAISDDDYNDRGTFFDIRGEIDEEPEGEFEGGTHHDHDPIENISSAEFIGGNPQGFMSAGDDAEDGGNGDESDGQECCEVCGSTSTKDKPMLLCDECNEGYHTTCLKIGLPDMKKDWFCPTCTANMERGRAAQEAELKREAERERSIELEELLQEAYDLKREVSSPQVIQWFSDEDVLVDANASVRFSEANVVEYDGANDARFGLFKKRDGSYDFNFFSRITNGVSEKIENPTYCWTMASCERTVKGGHLGRLLEVTSATRTGIAIARQLGKSIPVFRNDDDRALFLRNIGLRPPVQDSMRFLRRHFPVPVDSVDVETTINEKRFKTQFRSFSVLHCALHLYSAILNGTLGPFHAFDEVDCSALRQSGSRHNECANQIKERYTDLDKDDLVLFLCMYSDKTVTTLTSLHPIFVWLEGLDQDTRAANLLQSHYLLGLLPSLKTMTYFDEKRDRFAPITSMKDEAMIHRAARELRNECLRLVVLQLQATEGGVKVTIGGKTRKVRLFLSSYVCDMEEAREIFCLRLGASRWPCISCYDYSHGEHMPPADERLGNRSLDTDELLRREVRAAHLPAFEDGRKSAEKELRGKYGIQIKDQCPLTRAIEGPDGGRRELFLLDRSPSGLRSVDLLHNLDGVLRRIFELLQELFGSRSLANATKPFGNRSFGVVKTFTFHVMEHFIRDFGALVLGVAHGRFKRVVENKCLRVLEMLCWFQELIFILKDDAVGLLVPRLERVVRGFEKCFRELFTSDDDVSQVTPKIHEIFCHVVANVKATGCCRNLSAAIGERLHDFVKDSFHDSSLRETDSGEYILLCFFYRKVFADAQRSDTGRSISTTWTPKVEIRLCHPNQVVSGDLAPFIKQLRENFAVVRERYRIDGEFAIENAVMRFNDIVAFSSSIQGTIRWSESGGIKKRSLSINARPLPEVDDSWALAFKAHDARDSTLLADFEGTGVNCQCQHHDPSIQWGCSFVRSMNTAHALPIVFVLLKNGDVAGLVLRLKETKSKFPCMKAVFVCYTYKMKLDMILYGRFRGKARCYPLETGDGCYVSRGMSTTINTL